MAGILFFFWEGIFSGTMLVLGRVRVSGCFWYKWNIVSGASIFYHALNLICGFWAFNEFGGPVEWQRNVRESPYPHLGK